MTVVLVAPAQSADGDQGRDTRTQLQRWVDVLERRGHDVYLVGPSDLPIRVQHHVAARLDVADTVQALADAMQGVPPPIVLLDGGVRGSAVTVEEVESANGTVVLAEPHERDDGAARMPPDAPLRVAGDVVVAAGSSLHQLREWTHDGVGLLRVDAADTAAVASALRVMGDVAGAQKWKSQVLPLTTVAAVRAGVRVHAMGAGTLPWRVSELDGSDDPDDAEERRLRIAAAVGPAQGVVDRLVGIPLAERLAQLFWRLGVSGRTLAVLGVVSALFAGVLVSTGTAIAMVTGAAMLLASVIFDRIDGVLTRARRTASPFGAWLGATTDWFREAAVVIGLAVGAAAVAAPKWALACGVLALSTLAQLAIASGTTSRGWGGAVTPVRMPLDRLDEPADVVAQPPPQSRRRLPGWLPLTASVGDGAVITVLALAVAAPETVLTLLAVMAGISAAVAVALLGLVSALPAAQRQLLALTDAGPLAVVVGHQDPQLSLIRRVLNTPVAAWLPPATWALEAAVVVGLARWVEPESLPVALAWVAVVEFHRRDVANRIRVLAEPPPSWLAMVTLGANGRVVLLGVLAATGVLMAGLAVGAVVLAVVFAAESASRFAARPS